ncbi:unnamed protein product, partial [Cuscuta europaea]
MNVLDAWTMCLNTKEKPRCNTSPCRLFAKSIPCLYTMENPILEDQAYEVFKEGMVLALETVKPDVKMEDIDLFFFPIVQPKHCYVVCFHMKKQIVEVLDNIVDQMHFDEKYGEMPYILIDMFVDYLSKVGLDNDSNTFFTSNLKRLTMNWREAKNVHDYGLWSMRHMETYMGQCIKLWDCGVKKEDAKQ